MLLERVEEFIVIAFLTYAQAITLGTNPLTPRIDSYTYDHWVFLGCGHLWYYVKYYAPTPVI